ncbi:MAG: EutN/CcmL family microcompartment protein [Candidatus Schekmanbacteria bacterium]|nr:EutN/CcmL family microcompartment protein [Candidatus Schekmanbacteria bacterium]
MFIAKVIGNIVSTVKHQVYAGEKIMVVQPLDSNGEHKGQSLLALDKAQAGVGDTVLVINEGSSARLILNNDSAPARAVIMGIIDFYGDKIN